MTGRSRRAWAKLLNAADSTARSGTGARPRKKHRVAMPLPDDAARAAAATSIPAVQIADLLVVPKPTMHHSDRWAKRPRVLRARACADELRLRRLVVPEAYAFVVYLPMPAAWTPAERDSHRGQKHQVKPDGANLLKLIEDSLCRHDERLHDVRTIKRWSDRPRLVIVDTDQHGEITPADLHAWLPKP